MAETMSHVERVLWRIAELGARCSQQTAAGGRGPLWAELEQTIAELQADFEAARQATDIAPAQVRSLEGRLKVALRERDREKARIQEFAADAQAARRERDRERQKARKVMAAAVQARDAAAAAKASEARAVAARDQAVAALDDAIATGERAADARDAAVRARDEALEALERAQARIAELEAALDAARAGHDEAVDRLAARAESAVVVLPGVAMPDAEAAPVAPARRVSWQPTWSEWADPETVGATDTANAADAAATDEIVLDDSCTGEEGAVRYLNVAATIAQLLPEDLGPFLVDGATVVRREGRLFATLAVATGDWAAPGAAGAQQVQRFADAGFKVEWASNAPLGV
ncbi:MAG: hypothetical protein AB1679_34170 [Actinomycetota bacterium]|jgi:hypothetical protein